MSHHRVTHCALRLIVIAMKFTYSQYVKKVSLFNTICIIVNLLQSLNKVKDRRDVHPVEPSNSFWVYSLRTHRWSRIYYCRHSAQDVNSINKANVLGTNKGDGSMEPCPRYAHQLVYDEQAKTHYLFGGNPGIFQYQQLRLDDFWLLHLEK